MDVMTAFFSSEYLIPSYSSLNRKLLKSYNLSCSQYCSHGGEIHGEFQFGNGDVPNNFN